MDNQTAPSKEWLITNIRKLMAITVEAGATKEEAATAAAKAQELLQKYNLKLAELGQAPGEIKSDTVWQKNRFGKDSRRSELWKRNLAHAIGRHNFCEVLSGPHGATFIGYAGDVEVAQYIYNQLVDLLTKMVKIASRENTEKMHQLLNEAITDALMRMRMGHEVQQAVGTGEVRDLKGEMNPLVFRRSWLEGAVHGIDMKMALQDREFERSSKSASALIITRKDAVEKWSKERNPRAYKRKGWDDGDYKDRTNWDAFAAGRKAGEQIEVRKGIKPSDTVVSHPEKLGGGKK